jgi:hypothetical protein
VTIQDRTLEEIHEMFEARLPARRFKGFVCVGVERAGAAGPNGKEGGTLEAVHVEQMNEQDSGKTA